MKIILGNKVKDKVSGLEGIAIARHEFLNGCIRYTVQQKVEKDGKLPDEKWFDENQLEVCSVGVTNKIKPRTTGGPTGNKVPSQMRRR